MKIFRRDSISKKFAVESNNPKAMTASEINPENYTEAEQLENFLSAIWEEVHRARKLFPSPDGTNVALTEEVGELAKALLDEPWKNVYTEAVQVAVMAMRVALEGDPTLAAIREQRRNKASK